MKKLLILLIPLIFLTGCIRIPRLSNNSNIVNASFGTYQIDNLVKREDHSTPNKIFYSLEKDKYESRPDNISVEVGTNYYSKDEHLTFRRAIQEQLYRQVGRNAKITGTGIDTSKGNIVYKFLITKDNDKTEVTQYYIVGDHKYVLVYETNFSRNPDLDIAAYNIVDTFEWK